MGMARKEGVAIEFPPVCGSWPAWLEPLVRISIVDFRKLHCGCLFYFSSEAGYVIIFWHIELLNVLIKCALMNKQIVYSNGRDVRKCRRFFIKYISGLKSERHFYSLRETSYSWVSNMS